MLTSLDGARRNSTLPTGGTRPLQLSNRIEQEERRRRSGCMAAPAGPASPRPKSLEELVDHLEDVLAAPRDAASRRGSCRSRRRARRHDDPHREERELMLGWNVTSVGGRRAGRVEVDRPSCGAGNSRRARDEARRECARLAGRAAPWGTAGTPRKARMSRTMTTPISDEPAGGDPRPGASGAATASGARRPASVATCSLDTLPPHTGARPCAALGPCSSPRRAAPTPSS